MNGSGTDAGGNSSTPTNPHYISRRRFSIANAMRGHAAISLLGAASALFLSTFGACGSGKSQSDAGMTPVAIGLTPCRDLAPFAGSIVAAADSPHFLAINNLGASVIAIDG